MIIAEEYSETLNRVAEQYFVTDIAYIEDIHVWSDEKGIDLDEPSQVMKIIPSDDNRLVMVVQAEMPEESLNDIIKGLGVRWALKDTATDPEKVPDSTKKRLAFCFLKEYSRTVEGVGGDEMLEDEWSIKEMDKLGFFLE